MLETLVRVKKWRECWSVECWGLQHSIYFSREAATAVASQMVTSLLAKGEVARLLVEDSLAAQPRQDRAA